MKYFFILFFLLSARVAGAEGFFSLETTDDGRQWEAVGRLEIAGTAFCTGALIEPDLVLTAAHCLFDRDTGKRVDAKDIQFLAGWRNGRAAAYRRVKRAEAHPNYDFSASPDASRVQNDVALIRLQHPIRNGIIKPFDTDVRPDEGDRLGVVSYAHNRSEAPTLQETCEVLGRQEGVLVMSCEVDFGSSGSPVFTFDGDTPRIVSVVSAMAELDGQPVSLGTALDVPVAMIKQTLALDVVRNSLTAGARKDTGAKFIKP